MSDRWGYDGKRVVVTGCSSGIGAATAAELTLLGAEVIGLDLNDPPDSVKEFTRVDMGDAGSIDRAVGTIGSDLGALFNCAGISGSHPPVQVVRVNMLGLRHLTEALTAIMPPGASVASVSSLGGAGYERNLPALSEFLATPDFDGGVRWCEAHPEQFARGGYGFAKQAVIVYTMQRCVALAARGIRINSIGPGVTDTPMLADSVKAVGQGYLDALPKPLGRIAQPDEMARVLAFLNSDAASYLTGQHLWVDGGLMAGMFSGDIDRSALRGT